MKKLTLRLSDTLHTALKQLSTIQNRSLHGEIVYRLQRAVEAQRQLLARKELDHVE